MFVSEKPRVDKDTRATISEVYSTCLANKRWATAPKEIRGYIRCELGSSATPTLSDLTSRLNKACINGYLCKVNGVYILTEKGIDANGEICSEFDTIIDISHRINKYRNR